VPVIEHTGARKLKKNFPLMFRYFLGALRSCFKLASSVNQARRAGSNGGLYIVIGHVGGEKRDETRCVCNILMGQDIRGGRYTQEDGRLYVFNNYAK
jgi:hypothetical protein